MVDTLLMARADNSMEDGDPHYVGLILLLHHWTSGLAPTNENRTLSFYVHVLSEDIENQRGSTTCQLYRKRNSYVYHHHYHIYCYWLYILNIFCTRNLIRLFRLWTQRDVGNPFGSPGPRDWGALYVVIQLKTTLAVDGRRSALRRTRMCYFRPPGNDAASIEIPSCGKPGLLAACQLNHFMLRADRSDMDMHGPSALPCKFS